MLPFSSSTTSPSSDPSACADLSFGGDGARLGGDILTSVEVKAAGGGERRGRSSESPSPYLLFLLMAG